MRPGPGDGDSRGGISLEELPEGSVVYVSRGSFRMEAVGLGGEPEGVVQPSPRIATAPYHTKPPGENTGVDRLPVSATFRAPDVPSLFGSQVDVPVLAAPTAAPPPRQITVSLPRRGLVALGAMVFACGIVIGAAIMRPAPPVAVAPAAPPAPAPRAAAPQPPPADEAVGPDFAPPIITVPAPVKIMATKRAAARRAAPEPQAVEPAPAKPWVDPFAD